MGEVTGGKQVPQDIEATHPSRVYCGSETKRKVKQVPEEAIEKLRPSPV